MNATARAKKRPQPERNKDRRELTLDRKLVKRFRTDAGIQSPILSAFQALDWPDSLDNPFTEGNAAQRTKTLHNAIYKLNGHQQGPARIRFEMNGRGKIIWTVLKK